MKKLKREQLPDVSAGERFFVEKQVTEELAAGETVGKKNALKDKANAQNDEHGNRDGLAGSKHRFLHI